MQQLAHRLDRLGTETAFSVAQAAAAWKAKGHRVYPFHLGDINIPTAPHIVDAMNRAIADGYTGYCPGPGIPQLREALADDLGSARGIELSPDNVVVMTGGKPVITKFLQAVMNPGQEVLYPNPGFPIYESQIEYLGGTAVPYRYLPTNEGFAIDLDQLRASITSLPGMLERTVILYTFSKKFAMTGSRLGCAVAPVEIANVLSTLNTNDESCTTHYVQWAGIEALRGTQEPVRQMLKVLRERRDTAAPEKTNWARVGSVERTAIRTRQRCSTGDGHGDRGNAQVDYWRSRPVSPGMASWTGPPARRCARLRRELCRCGRRRTRPCSR